MSEIIAYEVHKGLYINLTNRCHCNCSFCVRNEADGINRGESLWLDHEPSLEEIEQTVGDVDFSRYEEVVFCGYGEPTERLDALIATAQMIKKATALPIRLNTNGLSDLINHKKTAPLLASCIDHVSISLNAPNKESYDALCHPTFGEGSFDALLRFALDCKELIPEVNFTIVDVFDADQQQACQNLCDKLGISLRIREREDL
ncbi:MAG: TIGR04100 family radical SAM protein [Coriobacteriia bacterium]|nr:TIGR04100 family radical SAM protein [Coriobacteriia bacterium]